MQTKERAEQTDSIPKIKGTEGSNSIQIRKEINFMHEQQNIEYKSMKILFNLL
jgi:hypothetical protein